MGKYCGDFPADLRLKKSIKCVIQILHYCNSGIAIKSISAKDWFSPAMPQMNE